MFPVCPIAGTWGRKPADSGSYFWWKPPSVWISNLKSAGYSTVDEEDYFDWSTNLDGVQGSNDTWQTAGKALYWWWAKHGRPKLNLAAHSHGGQVVAYALQYSLQMDDIMSPYRVVTIATPVRFDMQRVWADARKAITPGGWSHLYTQETGVAEEYQYYGSLPLNSTFGFRRDMPLADRNVEIVPATTHHGMIWSQLWNQDDLWRFFGDFQV